MEGKDRDRRREIRVRGGGAGEEWMGEGRHIVNYVMRIITHSLRILTILPPLSPTN